MAAVILLPLVAACALTQDRPDPALEVPRAYRAAHGSPNGARPPLDWWQTFRFTELTDLMQQASSANFSIAAVARIVQAGAQDRIAGAALLPTFNAMAIAQKSQISTAIIGSGLWSPGRGHRITTTYCAALNARLSYVLSVN